MADSDTPSLWQFVPVVTGIVGAGMSVAGGNTAAQGALDQGDIAFAAGQRSGAAYRDLAVRQAANERIKASRGKAATEFAAQQYAVNAGQAIAASQRDAVEERRTSTLLESRARAVAAASGAGAHDPSVANIVGRIRGEGAYRAATMLYAGEDKARVLRLQAAAKRYEGLTIEEAGALNAEEHLAAGEAKATSEEAKGIAAQAAAKTNAAAARMAGTKGALPGLNALAAGAALADKYGWFKGKDDASDLEDVPVEDAEISEEDINASFATTEADAAAFNLEEWEAAADATDAAAMASSVEDFSWLETLFI